MAKDASKTLQDKNQAFLDDVKDIVGSNWTITHENVEVAGRYHLQYLSFRVEFLDQGRKCASGFSDTLRGPVEFNDETFDSVLNSMRERCLISNEHYVTLKGRKALEFAQQLESSLTIKPHDGFAVSKKKMKI
jgi:hypothetical protein